PRRHEHHDLSGRHVGRPRRRLGRQRLGHHRSPDRVACVAAARSANRSATHIEPHGGHIMSDISASAPGPTFDPTAAASLSTNGSALAGQRPVPSAPRAEVEQPPATTITVDWDGVAVEIPAAIEDWDVEALEAFETGRAIRALRLLLGDEQHERILAAWAQRTGRRAKLGDLVRLFD